MGEAPIDYVEFAKRINFPVNLLEFWQISPDGTKEFRRLSTRVNKKKSSKKATSPFSSSVSNADPGNNSYTSLMSVEQKAFRIPVFARAIVNEKFLRVALPKHISRADQGSEMNVISHGLVKALKLEKQGLETRGFSGLIMNTADGGVSELSHFVSFEIGVFGIWRKIETFTRPTQRKK
ncbi:hypothetical protein GcM1_221029 [Golovinomyces cichoracearum]|uniref:Uncharacterized protein n=1 Tax=Golovinomyces cichoracearum TaxID=62708 RepID=A0A420IRN9_9PEZI|nr:hypothetical protein GcM1_221029 [Golovinomyces cichoracearum]